MERRACQNLRRHKPYRKRDASGQERQGMNHPAELKASIHFVHPYSLWERGLSENSNRLLRQYFPKGMDLTDVTEG